MDSSEASARHPARRAAHAAGNQGESDNRLKSAVPSISGPTGRPDIELLACIARADTAAFAEFYDRHSTLLYSLALRILNDEHESEEALQEAALLIWERAPLYDPALGQPLSWAVAIIRNKSIDRLRASQRKARAVAQLLETARAEAQLDQAWTLNQAIATETATLMRSALRGLPPEQRKAIDLAFFAGLTQSEIAEQLGEPLGTVKARIRRGMLALRDVLEHRL